MTPAGVAPSASPQRPTGPGLCSPGTASQGSSRPVIFAADVGHIHLTSTLMNFDLCGPALVGVPWLQVMCQIVAPARSGRPGGVPAPGPLGPVGRLPRLG
jgi:hypothetical protein